MVIGLMLIRSSLRHGRRSHDFLLGAWLVTPATSGGRRRAGNFTQPLRPEDEEKVRAVLLASPGVTAIRELLVTFVGPGQVWITARIGIDDNLSGAQVKSLIRNLESDLKHESEGIYRVDIVPVENHGP